MRDPATPVVVVGGYLGAGKTTMINELLVGATEPVAVIVNDFGDVNIDAALVRTVNPDAIELTNGCICCVAGNSLADTLFTVLERPVPPSMIVIEASGTADPSVVAGFSHAHGMRPGGTVVLVDSVNAARTASDRLVSRTFRRQIESADIIVITKSDAPGSSPDATRDAIGPAQSPVIVGRPTTLRDLVVSEPRVFTGSTAEHDDFTTETIADGTFVDEAGIRSWFAAAGPHVVRAKGVVSLADGRRILVQVVGATVGIEPTDLDATGVVVIRAAVDEE